MSAFGDLDNKPTIFITVKIKLKDNAEPYSLTTAKRIPIPLMDKVKVEFELMKRSTSL